MLARFLQELLGYITMMALRVHLFIHTHEAPIFEDRISEISKQGQSRSKKTVQIK